jgi:prevent-host-death family protein
MRHTRALRDIKPVSEFRSNAAALIQQVQEEKRPLILTQRGQSAAVLMAASEYDRLISELELLREVAQAEQQLAAGLGIPHQDALQQVLQRLTR